MPTKFLISESQLNRLVESENNDLKDIVSQSFDKNPSRFTKNLIDQIPELAGHEKKVKNKIVDLLLNNIGKVSVIGLLVLWMSVYIPYIMKKNEYEVEKEQQIKGDKIQNFAIKFFNENSDWNENGIKRQEAEEKVDTLFEKFIDEGNLKNYPLQLTSVSKRGDKSILVFSNPNMRGAEFIVSVKFIGTFPTKYVRELKEGNTYIVDFERTFKNEDGGMDTDLLPTYQAYSLNFLDKISKFRLELGVIPIDIKSIR